MHRFARVFSLLMALLFAVKGARAEVQAAADALFDEGSALLKAGRLEEACAKLAESQRIEPAIGTLGLLAYCHEQSGSLATALREYGEVANLCHLASQEAREKVARERISALAARVSKLELSLPQAADVTVQVGQRTLQPDELGRPMPMDPGPIHVRVTGVAIEPWEQTLTIPAEGTTLRVTVPLKARATPRPSPSPGLKLASSPPVRRGLLERPAVWTSFGAGALGMAIGGYFGLSALASRDAAAPHCQGNRCDQAGVEARKRGLEQAQISTIAFAVGSVAVATGVVVLLVQRPGQPEQRAGVALLPGGAGLGWERSF